MQSHSSSYSQCMFLVNIEIAARKHLQSLQNLQNSWMFSSANNFQYMIYGCTCGCIALLPCIRRKISFHKLLCMLQIFMRKIFVVQHYPWNIFSIKLFLNYDVYMYQMNSSESWPRKVELMHAHSIKNATTVSLCT